MIRGYSRAWSLRLAPALLGVLLLTLLLAPGAPAMPPTSGPVTWLPASSTYGAGETAFLAAPLPGVGMTQPGPLPTAYGAGFWNPDAAVYAMGFVNAMPAGSLPSMADTDITLSALPYGTPLKLVFSKPADFKVNSVAMLGDPNALVSIEPADPAALTAATQFTVRASVTDPVESYSGNVGAAFGLVVDCADSAARDYQNSLFVTNLHWLDIDPPTLTASGLAGLRASGVDGVQVTFDGIFAPAFLTSMGIADPTQVQGYVDVNAVTGLSGATFTVLGQGDGSLWPSGAWKYRLTNSAWCTHNILFGRLAKPLKAVGLSPKGTISGTRPTFKWRKLSTAKTYEVRVYKGSRLLLKKTGAAALSWRASKALPRQVYLTWKVRGVNASGIGSFSTALKFKIR
jgi:hypothetical protein